MTLVSWKEETQNHTIQVTSNIIAIHSVQPTVHRLAFCFALTEVKRTHLLGISFETSIQRPKQVSRPRSSNTSTVSQ